MVAALLILNVRHLPHVVKLFLIAGDKLSYQKLSDVLHQFGYSVKDVQMDGNCGLHAVVDQLERHGVTKYTTTTLCQKAVDAIHTRGHKVSHRLIMVLHLLSD